VVILDNKVLRTVRMEIGERYCNRDGAFLHDNLIGEMYGKRLYTHNGKGFIVLLRHSAQLHTMSLRMRTQILYTPDISQILLNLDLQPGKIVIESGTGSGSLSTSMA